MVTLTKTLTVNVPDDVVKTVVADTLSNLQDWLDLIAKFSAAHEATCESTPSAADPEYEQRLKEMAEGLSQKIMREPTSIVVEEMNKVWEKHMECDYTVVLGYKGLDVHQTPWKEADK